jgi:hypothetical protein
MKRILTVLLLSAGWLAAEVPSAIAIRNAKIVTVGGPVINRGTVVMRNGLIEAVGENVTIPADAWVEEGEGLTVYPGLMDALSTVGLPAAAPAAATGRAGAAAPGPATTTPPAPRARGPEDRPSTQSWLRAADQVSASDRRIETLRSSGFTSAVVFPSRGIFAGQGAIVALGGERAAQMVIASPAGQYLPLQTGGFSGGFPSASFGVIAYIRQLYLDLEHYQQAKAMYNQDPKGMPRPPYDRALEGLMESPRILLPAVRSRELIRMRDFGNDLKQPYVLYGAHEGYKVAEQLKGASVLVNLKWPERARDGDPDEYQEFEELERREKAPSTPAALAKAGVKFAFYTDGQDRLRDVARQLKKAIDAGLTMDQAIRAFTLSPAEIFGVADRLGSVEKGKIANLVVTKGDLFQERPAVQMVFIDGVKYLPAPETETPAFPGARPGGPTGPFEQIIEEVRQ